MFKLKLWNRKYGKDAKFIVQNPEGKFTEFSLRNPKDVAWVDTDLTKVDEYKGWDNFQDEPVKSLSQIIM